MFYRGIVLSRSHFVNEFLIELIHSIAPPLFFCLFSFLNVFGSITFIKCHSIKMVVLFNSVLVKGVLP